MKRYQLTEHQKKIVKKHSGKKSTSQKSSVVSMESKDEKRKKLDPS